MQTMVDVELDWGELDRFLDALIKHCMGDTRCIDRYLERFLTCEEVELGGRVYRFCKQPSQQ